MKDFYIDVELSKNLGMTDEGYLICKNVPITRAGDLYYKASEVTADVDDSDDIVKVTRTTEDIHDADTISSFNGKPVTIGHPATDDGLIDIDDFKTFSVGFMTNVRPGEGDESDKLLADLVITDKEAISAIKSGMLRQVSCGYLQQSVTNDDGTISQKNIRGNHLALVTEGRAGPECAIRDEINKEVKKVMALKNKMMSIFSKALDEAIESEKKGEDVTSKSDADECTTKDEDNTVYATQDALDNLASAIKEIQAKLAALLEANKSSQTDEDDTENKTTASDSDEDDKSKSFDAASIDKETLSNAEIIAPGIQPCKNFKRVCLDACSKTEDGSIIINKLAPKGLDSAHIDTLFTATAEMLKQDRKGVYNRAVSLDSNVDNTQLKYITQSDQKKFWENQK